MYLVSLGNTANTAGFQEFGINVPPAFLQMTKTVYPIFRGSRMRIALFDSRSCRTMLMEE